MSAYELMDWGCTIVLFLLQLSVPALVLAFVIMVHIAGELRLY